MPHVAVGLDGLRKLAGADLGTTDWISITQDRVNTFAEATGDHQWIHVDVQRAKDGPFRGTIAHGYLTLALLIPLWTQLLRIDDIGMAINYGLNRVRFPAPVPVGSQIRLRARVSAVEDIGGNVGGDIGDAVQLTVEFTVELHGSEKPAVAAQALYRYHA